MPNIAKLLKEEIARIARREVRAGLAPLKRENVALKKRLAALRKTMSVARPAAVPTPVAARRPAVGESSAPATRVYAKTVRNMRNKLGLTQVEFGKLMGVSAQTVYQWERKEGPLALRKRQLETFGKIRGIGKREAARLLAAD